MATLVLGAAGAAIGGSIGGAILGVSAATIGGFVGSTIGSVVDSWIVSSLAPTQRIEGPRLDSLRITSSTEGAVIPRVYGRMRMGGNVIWATDFREETKTTTQGGGKGGGGGGKVKTTEYLYYASFAVALCEGPITGIGRIWADGKLLDTAGITWRWYPGDETQAADPFIAAKMGAANTPAYRGTAYVVFEELPLGNYGNRLPQLSFEVFRPLADPDTAEGLTRAVTMIPASGEFTYATTGIRKGSGGAQVPENLNALSDTADMVMALDRLQAMAPKVESVSLVVAWFGNDLRVGDCAIRPGVEVSAKTTSPQTWSVNGVSRAAAHLVSRDDQDRPVYGGTPSDFAVVQAIKEMKARGLRVTFYPFILMDVPPDNTLPNPYSDNAAEAGQPAFPWRGRITCSPAAGYAGSVDKTATAAAEVSAFFGGASSSDFAVSGETVSWTGAAGDWGLRRMVLHYAHLCAAAGGVSNGRGKSYRQRITLDRGRIDGACSCPVGHNCKHVAAALMKWAAQQDTSPGLAPPVQGWLSRVRESAASAQPPEHRPEDYPANVKDRLLYVLAPHGAQLRIDICKGRINAAGTALNKSIRRYDAAHALRSTGPAKFIRPVDLDLLSALAQARLWDAGYGYGLPDLLRPRGADAIALVRRLCDTGRLLHDTAPDARLDWSGDRPAPRLAWRMAADGRQRLGFEDAAGQPLHLRSLEGATLWVDATAGRIGALEETVDADLLQLVATSPDVCPDEVKTLGAALPETLAGLDLPRPRVIRQTKRAAKQRVARLTLGRETAHDGPRYFGSAVQLPTLTLRFVYDGQEVWEGDADPRMVDEDGEIVTLTRDHRWEAACATRLMKAGALPVEELEVHWPGERMMDCDFVFADDEMNLHTLEMSDERAALDFAFRVVPELRRDGWEVVETPKWPYRLSEEAASLTVATRTEAGEAFQGNDWFSLGFQAEIGGRAVDVAPLVAAFLDQIREDWDAVPDVETLARHLSGQPVYLDRGKQGYVALDLSPLAPLLHLFLTHHAELGALHPSDAEAARLAEEALAGSDIRFADKAGILPLARSLRTLAEADGFVPPAGLTAELRDYQAYGAAWMGSLLEAGFGGVLADAEGAPEALVEGDGPHLLAWRDWSEPADVVTRAGCFDTLGVSDLISAVELPHVRLPNSASMFIEPTRALVAVDVNTGNDGTPAAGLKVNIAAARELPRQLRLRGLGGQITLDLAPMPKKDRKTFEAALRAALRADQVETALAGWTPLGHYELHRKRDRTPLQELLK